MHSLIMFALAALVSAQGALVPQGKLAGPFPVVKITDGDTVTVRFTGKLEDVRLAGIDTPEKYGGRKLNRDAKRSGQSKDALQALGRAASKHTRTLVEGEMVWIEVDVQERDRYGRLLAYLYLADPKGEWTHDGRRLTQVNLAIVRAGWADSLTIAPNVRYADLYTQAAREAKGKRLGAWAAAPPKEDICEPRGRECPAECPVKGNVNKKGARWFHLPAGQYYSRTNPEACFIDAAAAVKAGYQESPR